ncbi:hypothetical protein KQX54_016554 [Cotesia glomerata]|uniref:Uncharacterized protein n=1 Tax=Cotesia glomerata TaxID=32391 RepID=A0AAV7HY15_COTGL|nr:hypothetical protein KQX54_016554 [Cotesia glomerata]
MIILIYDERSINSTKGKEQTKRVEGISEIDGENYPRVKGLPKVSGVCSPPADLRLASSRDLDTPTCKHIPSFLHSSDLPQGLDFH